MTGDPFLTRLAGNLRAAAAAAPQMAQGALADGRRELEVGSALGRPGPGLTQLLRQNPKASIEFDAGDAHPLEAAENLMVNELVDRGLRAALDGGR